MAHSYDFQGHHVHGELRLGNPMRPTSTFLMKMQRTNEKV